LIDAPSSTPRTVLRVDGLRKTYGRTVAVAEVSLEVFEGEIFGLIGPNGAGKTTTMECVEGIRKADAGTISVLSLDPRRNAVELQNLIGIQLQQAQLQKRIKVWEAVDLWSFLYPRAVDGDALLDRLGLAEKKNAWFMTLSGGQKQRLFIALALINDPELVFLDELTTGLDPQARHAIWALVRDIKQRGKTVFLTTHLMEEAEKLCDRVAILEHGRVIAVGSPEELVRRHCPQRTVVFTTEQIERAALFAEVPGTDEVEVDGSTVTLRGQGEDFVSAVIHRIAESGVRVADFRTVLPSLEDVFLKLTGHRVRD
jgi:ABC-2 type transport system ATP-binding protein